ncbi:MAG: AAA family ATPase, partial [Usitatibacter sp.]
ILVGERTRRAVSGFGFGAVHELALKGKREPIGAAALIERLAERRAARAPFLGRDHDLAQLDLVARRAFSERRPQLVTITAPAGTGKSRLVEEFAGRIRGGARVVTAQCLPYGSAVTFLPLRGLVRELLGAEREEDTLPGLRRTFVEAGHSEDDASRLAALIGVTLGDETESERRDRDELFTAWRLLVEAQAARGPLVVVFEDLHWATDTLLDLVEHVTVSRVSTPLVMFALARPELLDRRSNWGGGRRNFTSLGLEPLSDEETRGLVAGLTEGVPRAIADRIVERSGGNPFFAGELVRAYAERRREGALDAEILLPDTVHATVLARIDKLPAEERSIMELAAVAGRTARASAIHALVPGLGEGRIVEALEALSRQDFLVPHGADAYTFRHIVIREVAYATLPRAERVRAHLRLAQWFEESSPARANEFAEVVAYHYRQAIALSPGARIPEGLPVAKVLAALERAARAAANAAAFTEAAEQLRETVRLAPAGEHLRLHELRGDLLLFGDDAIGGYAEAYERWRVSPDTHPGVGARLLVKRLMVAARWSGSIARPLAAEEFDALATEARRLLDLSPDEMFDAKLVCARTFERTRYTKLDAGVVEELLRGCEGAAALFASRGDIEGESEALDALAAVQRSAHGDREGAIATTQRRLANVGRLSLLERIDAWSVLIWDLVFAGRYEEAIRTYGESRKARRAGEPERVLSHGAAWAALAAMLCGRWDDALVLSDSLLAMREESPGTIGRFTFPGWVAALRVASARQDTTRLARYRSAFVAIADVSVLPEPNRSLWVALIERDAQAARRYLAGPVAGPDRKGELLALMLFELGERPGEEELAALERQSANDPPVLALRVQLARALNGEAAQLRQAIAALDAGHL